MKIEKLKTGIWSFGQISSREQVDKINQIIEQTNKNTETFQLLFDKISRIFEI